MMPKSDLEKTVRAPISATEAKKVLKHLDEWDEEPSNQWKVRTARNQDRLESGDPFRLSRIYLDLVRFQKDRARLSQADKRQMELSLDLLSEELAIAMGRSQEEVQGMIEERIAARLDDSE